MFEFVDTLEAKAPNFNDSKISTLFIFNLPILLAMLNDNAQVSYNTLTSTLWIFNISFHVALISKLPLISTALTKTRLPIPACKIYKATVTSVFG